MKTLVAYVSQTGNTRKVAEAIYGEVTGDKALSELSELDDLEGFDLCFFGFPIIAFGPNVDAREFLEANCSGKRIALFITHAAPEDQEDVAEWLDKCRGAAEGAELMGVFDCQGELSEEIAAFLLKSDDARMRSFGERRGETLGQPDESRLERARSFAREIIERF